MNPILIVAAETSSTLYAQRLLEYWKREQNPVSAFGVGNEAMKELGFDIVGRSEEMAVMGLVEPLASYPYIKRTFNEILKRVKDVPPPVALLMDYSGFNLKLAAHLKDLNVPVVYYISPQVWAWRQKRVHKIKRLIDKMLVIFPFEQKFYEQHRVATEFVGHPLLDELDERYFSKDSIARARSRYGIRPEELLLALMPGSRKSELKYNLDTQLKVARRLLERYPQLKVALFVAPNFSKEEFVERLGALDSSLIIVKDEPFEMIHMADLVLTASGTATLMVGLLEKPMVIMYKMNSITAVLAKVFVKATKYFGMINLVLEKEVVPELFQEQASIENLKTHLSRLIEDPQARQQMATELAKAKSILGEKGATRRVANCLRAYLEEGQ